MQFKASLGVNLQAVAGGHVPIFFGMAVGDWPDWLQDQYQKTLLLSGMIFVQTLASC